MVGGGGSRTTMGGKEGLIGGVAEAVGFWIGEFLA